MKNFWLEEEEPSPAPEAPRSTQRGRPMIEGLPGRSVNWYARADVERWLREQAARERRSLSAVINFHLKRVMDSENERLQKRGVELAGSMGGGYFD